MLQDSKYNGISEKIMCMECCENIKLDASSCDEYEREDGLKWWVCRNCDKLINIEDIGNDDTILVLSS